MKSIQVPPRQEWGSTRLSAAALLTPEQVFTALWDTLADTLGSAAAAALLRRAQRTAAAADASLQQLSIQREGFSYVYEVPAAWRTSDAESFAALHTLADTLRPLLIELTGPVVCRQLARVTLFAEAGIQFAESGPGGPRAAGS